ncbi:CTQ-dependent lysine 6-oxidase LodA [uncultured Tateyamaria sp.]|uniref:CTQ-dependent lysine 6-oxidase LodA n=1 Tax=uncultured Tateyamaria sp. TaxID=455651 RepID=UPI0026386361|nr:CTQ-dependent lysine 6-oxidase LodA [uncultured Tateyamaria sp.]
MPTFEIHPRIGVARLGNSLTDFYLSPTETGGLPVACDEWGNETPDAGPVTVFKDATGAIKRQAAKFHVFQKDDDGAERKVSLDDAEIDKIEWVAHVANKKPIWYTFSELLGDLEFGESNSYDNNHVPWNNPDVTSRKKRQKLIIDPGPRHISTPQTSIDFSRYNIPEDYKHGSFPDPSNGGQQIDTLGELKMDAQGSLIALGGFGRVTGSAEISSFRGAAGYWDDIADGYVFARVTMADGTVHDTSSAWLVVGSPKYAPEIVNITTLADTMDDVAVRKRNARPDIFPGGDTSSDWPRDPRNGYTPLQGFNPDYVVNFERDVQPIIDRMGLYKYVANVPTMDDFANPKFDMRDASDGNSDQRMRYFNLFRMPLLPKDYSEFYATMSKGPGQLYALKDNDPDTLSGLPMMPLNSGDNSVTNTGPIYKFETLSPTQYFYLYQWACGRFTTDKPDPLSLTEHMDRVDASNCVGAPFSPGIEVTWSVRSPLIYDAALHLKLAHDKRGYAKMSKHYEKEGLSVDHNECAGGGCEPGDLTKRMAIPWMADFHECTVQTPNLTNIRVNQLADGSGIEVPPAFYVYWWPPQSPFNVTTGTQLPQDQVLDAFVSDIDGQTIVPQGQNVEFQRGIDSAQKMIDSWFMLGFLLNRGTEEVPYIVETERNFGQLAQAHITEIASAAAAASTAAKG